MARRAVGTEPPVPMNATERSIPSSLDARGADGWEGISGRGAASMYSERCSLSTANPTTTLEPA